MTSPSSSISSSSAARYVGFLVLGLALGLALVALLAAVAIRQNAVDFGYSYLYRHQLEKLGAGAAPATLFLGDSSLGNAIDAGLWSELSGEPAVNLALTGTFGFAGSHNMLRRQLETARPRLVVVMQTPEILSKEFEHEGVLISATSLGQWSEIPPLTMARLLLRGEIAVSMLKRLLLGAGPAERAIADDYIAQRAPLSLEERREKAAEKLPDLRADRIEPGKTRYLQLLAELCRAEGLTCVYAHGPWFEELCKSAGEYLREADRRIAEAGLAVVDGTPLCLPAEEMGDNNDHARGDLKGEVTRRYFALVAAALAELPANRTEPPGN